MKRFTSYYPLISFPLLLTFLPTLLSTLTVLNVLVCDLPLIGFAYKNTGEGFSRSIANLPGLQHQEKCLFLHQQSLTACRPSGEVEPPETLLFHDWTVQSQCGCGSCTDIHSSYKLLSTTGMSFLEGSAPECSTSSILSSASVEF